MNNTKTISSTSIKYQIMDFNESNMWYLIFSILLAILAITIIILRFKNRRKTLLANRLPGPDGLFLVGLLPIALQGAEEKIKTALTVYRTNEKSLFKCWLVNNLYIVLTRPEDIELVLSNPKFLQKGKEYSVLQESIMGQGIFSIEDVNKWKNHRKMVTRGFSFSLLKSFIPIFYEEANVLAEILIKKCDLKSNECDVSVPVSMATMEMIGKTALGVTFNAQTGGRNRFVENLQAAMHTWEYRFTHPWYLSKTLFRLSSIKKVHDRSQKIINEYTDEIIQTKSVDLNQNAQTESKVESDDSDVSLKTQTLIEILLQSTHKLSYEQIRDEIITIMIGGQETTAMANACTIFMLAHHQDVQNKVFEELQSIFLTGEYDRVPTYEDLQKMEYLERVIKETLRLFPPLPLFARTLNDDINIGEHLCPAGATLIVCPLFLQSSPLYYSDPDKFDPDNFLPDACHNRHPYAYVPFSAGLRNCIGVKYAMFQMKTVLSTLLRKVKLFPSDRCPTPKHLRYIFLATLKLVDGCYVKMEPRI